MTQWVTAAVLAGRRRAESRMTDTCRIKAPGSGDGVRNPDTGEIEYPEGPTVYEGVCRVKAENSVVTEAEAGERTVGVVRWTVSLPMLHPVWDTSLVGRGHTVEVLTSELDPGLVGRKFTVGAGFVGSQNTARRLPVEAVAL